MNADALGGTPVGRDDSARPTVEGAWTVGGLRASASGAMYCEVDLPGHVGGVRAYGNSDEAQARAAVIVAAVNDHADLVGALFEFVSYSMCRQANTAERKMLAEHFAALGKMYEPLLHARGLSPSQISRLDLDVLLAASKVGA